MQENFLHNCTISIRYTTWSGKFPTRTTCAGKFPTHLNNFNQVHNMCRKISYTFEQSCSDIPMHLNRLCRKISCIFEWSCSDTYITYWNYARKFPTHLNNFNQAHTCNMCRKISYTFEQSRSDTHIKTGQL